MDDSAIVILCTAPDGEVAARLARGLVEARLAACVNALPQVRSIYRWKGETQDDTEVQLLIKTRRSRFDAVSAWLAAHHPYEVPEVVAIPAVHVATPYLDWLFEQTAADQDKR